MKHLISSLLIIFCHFQIFSQKYPKKIRSSKIYIENNQVFKKDSTPLNGYYKIKYIDFLNDWKTEVSYFKNGFRYGDSKVLRFNKLEEEGTYVNGLKHGDWRRYFYANGELELTTEYRNGLKNGKEFGKQNSSGKFIRNYVNDTLEGVMLKYGGYYGYLESKTNYKKGEKTYLLKYDDFLNVTEKNYFSNKSDGIKIEEKIREIKNKIYIDSVFNKKNIPFRIKRYENDIMYSETEIFISKDSTRKGENDYVFTAKFYDNNRNERSLFIYYNQLLLESYKIDEFKKNIIKYNFNPCHIGELIFIFNDISQMHIYFKYNKKSALYKVEFNQEDKSPSRGCVTDIVDKFTLLKQTY